MKHRPVIVGLGEVLWDVFPDGARFGGAPANFACTAAGLAHGQAEIQMVSAVGRDELGRKALADLAIRNVGIAFVAQVDYPTGQVDVHLDQRGHASYQFASNTAWDHLEWSSDLERLALRADVVCFGTLGQRSTISQQTIRRFVSGTPNNCLRLLDINLRSPYWNGETICNSLSLANALKLNDTELSVVAGLLQLHGSEIDLLQQLLTRYSLEFIALTRGTNGSLLLRQSGERSESNGQPVDVVDTVGAGDAFTAAMVIGLHNELPLNTINRWAGNVAASVCTQPGATPQIPENLRLFRV